ncbi:MAG: ROK family protein [Candidatus Omnitrophica bacterium]|nr:ROK family protein [Candidatus Omnitrophota bacterium]
MSTERRKTGNARFTIGVDFGGTNVKLALVSFIGDSFKIEGFSSFQTKDYKKDELIEQLVIRIIKLKAESTYKGNRVRGVGIGVPGRVDFNQGLVFDLTNVPGWKNVHLRDELISKVKIPVLIDNDANLMALAESKFGAAKGHKDCLCVTMGTGIGGGIVLDGKIYRGMNFAAGEIGHMTINENGPLCVCGGKGCVERYVGNRYILESAIKRLRNGAKSILKNQLSGTYLNLTLEMLSKAARQKDPFAMLIWQEVGLHMGAVLANVVNLLNPEIIVIGGGVANAGNLILDPIRRIVRDRAFQVSCRNLKIVPSKFKEKAGIIGAASLVLANKEK